VERLLVACGLSPGSQGSGGGSVAATKEVEVLVLVLQRGGGGLDVSCVVFGVSLLETVRDGALMVY
jgi:hypothetical protein